MTNVTATELDEILWSVMRRATIDADFRALAARDAAAAIERMAGKRLELDIRFVDMEASKKTFILPPMSQSNGEMTIAELEMVAGGDGDDDCSDNPLCQTLDCSCTCIATCYPATDGVN